MYQYHLNPRQQVNFRFLHADGLTAWRLKELQEEVQSLRTTQNEYLQLRYFEETFRQLLAKSNASLTNICWREIVLE